jgi:hypothetical protein
MVIEPTNRKLRNVDRLMKSDRLRRGVIWHSGVRVILQ